MSIEQAPEGPEKSRRNWSGPDEGITVATALGLYLAAFPLLEKIDSVSIPSTLQFFETRLGVAIAASLISVGAGELSSRLRKHKK